MSRLFLEATLRRTPLPQSERGLALPDRFLLDPLTYQQRPAELALKGLRPRILLADVVGLGKTLEIGLILAELIRRGRGDRILVVTPQQVLEQFQQELWTRFAIPLIRLDSVGIQRIQREIPAGRNPFTFYKRIIISIDTLKGDAYRHHLDNMQWDAVVIDESHNLIGESSLRNKLARRLAPHTDALLLASATPHNGDAESFAELISMLDPAAIADKRRYEPKDIEHLYIRRTKISPEVTNEIGGKWRERGPSQAVRCPATPEEERVFDELTATWLGNHAPGVTSERRLFPYTLLKAFLSSHKALAKTAENRLKNATDEPERQALTTLRQTRRADHRRRTPPNSPPWSPSSGKSASGPAARPARSSSPRASPLSNGCTRCCRSGSGSPSQARSTSCTAGSPISSRRRSSSVSPWRMSRCGSCSPATWPPRA